MEAQINHNEAVRKIETVLYYIQNAYVDTVQISKLAETAIVSILEELDPHSIYIPKEEVQAMNEPLEGNFEGIGIQFQIFQDTILVLSTILGGPSEQVGIRAGDKIVRVNDTLVAGVKITNREVMKKLRGPKGTKVKVSVLRSGESDLLDFVITRDKIPIYSIDASYMIDKKTGYIKLSRFAKDSDKEFKDAVAQLKKEGMENLILDLQGNGGGYLNTAVELADEFLGDNKLIVYTEGVHQRREDYRAMKSGVFEKGKLIILVDEGSASASEIVSGAIQDWDRGLIVGRRTFGKGLVQKPYVLSDGSFIRLTTARYYTPTGRSIQKPYDKGTTTYRKEIFQRYQSGELSDSEKVHLPDSLKFKTPAGRMVLGGGGILPDVFVPIDTSMYSDYYATLIRKGILNDFSLMLLDKNREKWLAQYPTMKEFKQLFSDTSFFSNLIAYAISREVKQDEEQIRRSERLIQIQLKAMLARNLYGITAYFYIFNELNPVYRKGVELINSEIFKEMKLTNK